MTDSPIIFDKGPASRTGTSVREDLLALDSRLLGLVARRCRMVQRAAKGRQVLDRELEKELWAAFDQASRKEGLDPRLSRQLFALVNGFGLEAQPSRRDADKPFIMIPRSEAADVDVTGPRSLALTRMLAVMAAATGQPLRLTGVVLNDPLVELIKALNQAGAHLSWTDDGLEAAPVKPAPPVGLDEEVRPLLTFEEQLIFAGDEPFTLFVLLALALREAGRSKFAGGAGLKMLDLRALDALLPHLGARLAPMNPRSRGLPARLESGGRMASRLELTPETPPLFAQAVALAAWSYPEGLRLALPKEPASAALLASALDDVVAALKLCNVAAKRKGDEFVIPACTPKVPAAPALPLDPALSSYLLCLPVMAGGQAKLAGETTLQKTVAADFAALGIAVRTEAGATFSGQAALAPHQSLGMGADPQYLPLALCLALRAGGGKVALPAGAPGIEARAWALDLLERLGAEHEAQGGADGGGIAVLSGPKAAWDSVWTSPHPYVTLGLALLSFIRPGIAIDNPGGLASLWPRFWALYNAMPKVRDPRPAPKEPEKVEAKPRNRRVRVRE